MDKKFFIFAGTRPNFMKIAPLCRQMELEGIEFEIYHSGQHYDTKLSHIFIEQLSLSKIHHMECNSRGNAIQTIQSIVKRTGEILKERKKEVRAVIVVGDVSTTYAVALAAKKLHLKIVHVEAGLRSFDIAMPEELNRITVDHLSDFLFASCADGVENLKNEGIENRVYNVGNIMIDSITAIQDVLIKNSVSKNFIVITFHRPCNVDNKETLSQILLQMKALSERYDIYFFVHPRTKKRLQEFDLWRRLFNKNMA